MNTVAEILRSKPAQTVHALESAASVHQAVALMADRNVGAIVVLESGKVVGIVSERDCARKLVLTGRSAKDTPLVDIMSAPVMFVHPHRTVEECMALMTENRLRHLPVMEREQLIGLISIGDLVKALISEQQFIIDQLEHYISGDREPGPSSGAVS